MQTETLAYYFEDEPGRQPAAKLLTRDQVRRIVADVAKVPELFDGGIRLRDRLRFPRLR